MTHDHDATECAPLRLDFDRLAAQIRETATDKKTPLDSSISIAHTAFHLRDELPDLSARQIARVLLATSFLMARLHAGSPKWGAIGLINVLAGTGERLWRAAATVPNPQSEQR